MEKHLVGVFVIFVGVCTRYLALKRAWIQQ